MQLHTQNKGAPFISSDSRKDNIDQQPTTLEPTTKIFAIGWVHKDWEQSENWEPITPRFINPLKASQK